MRTQFEQLGDLGVLAGAVELHRQALALRPPGDPLRSSSLNNLANAMQTRFEQFGDLDSLAEAVELHREALALRPPGHPDRSMSLNNLATAVGTRFNQLGNSESLAEAVELHRQALILHPPGNPYRYMCLSNLAFGVRDQFEYLGKLDLLAEAVELHREALALRPKGHPDHSLFLANLAGTLLRQYEEFDDTDSLAEAVGLFRIALDLRPPGHPSRLSSLRNLAQALGARYQEPDNLPLSSIKHPVISRVPVNPPSSELTQSQPLNDACNDTGVNFSTQQCVSDLDEELYLYQEGLHSCPDGHRLRMRFLFEIGQCRLRTGTHVHNFLGGIHHILEALQDRGSPARHSLRYAVDALRMIENAYQFLLKQQCASEIGKHPHDDLVLQVYVLIIRLLPRAASFGLDQAGRLRELAGADAISRGAATRAIAAGRNTEAVEMLEEGRGIFWSQALRLRTTQLDLLPPQDAQELRRLFRLLDVKSIGDEPATALQQERLVEQRRRLSDAAEALIADIRSSPGMDRFLLPPTYSSLVQSLPQGFVVFLNISGLGDHALILDGIAKSVHSLMLKLPARVVGTRRKAVKNKLSELRDMDDGIPVCDSARAAAVMEEEEQFRAGVRERATFEDSLADLWVCIVKPIIDLLQLKVCTLASWSNFAETHICRRQTVETDRVSGGVPQATLPSFQFMLQAVTQEWRESALVPVRTAHQTTLSLRTSTASRHSCEPGVASA
jgi:tetratricopeptide (TPR) repeat protein